MGKEARAFADFLAAGGQRYWQLLPLGPTGYGDSPYQSFSTFAGNPYLIDLDFLAEEGLLTEPEYAGEDWGEDPQRVDFGLLYRKRYPVLKKAVRRLLERKEPEYETFLAENAHWLPDYALFMALKDAGGGAPWWQWPEELRRREPHALARTGEELREETDFWRGVQYLFFRQ